MQPTYPPRGYAQQQQQPHSGGPNAPQYGYPPNNAAMMNQQAPRSSPAGPQPGERAQELCYEWLR